MKLTYLFSLAFSLKHASGRWIMDNRPPTYDLLQGAVYPLPQYVTQPQDHFDSSSTNQWQQAYYVNNNSWTPGSDAPVFLCVGGEGPPIDGSAVVSSEHCNVAVEWLGEKKALMFALEHRYYGCHNMSACPVQNFSDPTSSLKYLSSRQAVEDVALFVKRMTAKYGLTEQNKWVTWGGSYPGMMAGFSRLKHPELIHAAVASSAPVHAKLDMSEYQDAVAHAYTVGDNNVGGSVECRDAIRNGHKAIEDLLEGKNGSAKVENLLELPEGSLATRTGQQGALGSGVANFPCQGNDPSCTEPACNIASVCKIMLNRSLGSELSRLVALRKVGGANSVLIARPNSKQEALPDFWGYQTCTEFGFFQTCLKDSSCMFVRGLIDLDFFTEDCKQYGISVEDITKSIAATNEHYGGLTPTGPSGKLGSCVLWPNGEVDPWASLSVLTSPDEKTQSQPVLLVPGASHHAWTHPTSASDQASVVDARALIRKQVEAFLEQDCGQSFSLVV